MERQYAIFDLDGTLLDSMQVWRNLGKNYLLSRGVRPPENLLEILKTQTLGESADYFRNDLGLSGTVEEILNGIHEMITREYAETIQAKPFVRDYLEKLHTYGQKLCIATATPANLAVLALKRLGLLQYFSFILDCGEAGSGKNSPDIYLQAAGRLGASIEACTVYEDALHAIKTAKTAGFYVIGVQDASASQDEAEIRMLCDRYIRSYKELLEE
ncbi:HAD family hydrolase [Marasmitruncus massiliensis]|uniref:HAD family hydrolase n=1 Tax=Marasmitruncus massiliensis TaxID=1944642 RepID=UPI000C7E4058|nr:HAD family phosphatase [Marasmitruncus massiliensis]